MASPLSERLLISPKTPGSRVLQTPLSDEAIWKRLRESGLDEESIKRRDKASLVAYIAKLEAEVSQFLISPLICFSYISYFCYVVLIFLSCHCD